LPDLHGMNAEISCEAPSKAVNEFVGALRKDNEDFALGITQFLPRGARIKNTKWAYGVTVYTGHDTRLLQNSTAVPFKVSRMDTLTNRRILILFIIMILISVFCAVAAAIYNADYLASAFYLDTPNGFIFNMLSFYLLLNYLIPISLQVTLEVVRFFQARFINKDIQMYDEENDVRCHVRTSNLNDELGQVKFIMTGFSVKF
jgi:phospholipid-transporting ATPase